MKTKLKILMILFIFKSITVSAQDDATNTGVMFISNATIVAAEGSFTTTSSGSTENGGDFYLKGHWTNDGTYITSTGKITFWGSNAQTINGTVSTVFYDAEEDKPSNGVSLNVYTGVANTLTLTNGEFDLNSQKLTISNSDAAGIGYTNGYLLSEKTDNSSRLQWNIRSVTGAHVIPFGKSASMIIPLTLDLTSGDVGDVTTSTYSTSAANTPYPTAPVTVLNVNGPDGFDNSASMVDRFWEIDRTGEDGTFTVTFTYDDLEKPANGEINLEAERYNSSLSQWDAAVPFQASDAVVNTVTAPGVTTFGPYVLTQSAQPLPVELLAFNALPTKQKQVNLIWVTASEENSDFFTIERSRDNKKFEAVTHVKAAGYSTSTLNYKTPDKNPYDGVSYYRLKQVNFNGSFFYSEVKKVNFNESDFNTISVFPNPAISSATIYFNNTEGLNEKLNVDIYDAVGKLILSKDLTTTGLMNKDMIVVERNNMAAGLYSVKILNDSQLLYAGRIIFK
ncbi:MAG TPA: T9SS type A sorting domain-containing protein [Bacteroidia bacterium]|nr:T9SS type A sorting domain-containing protein [Bacteroidia bacterium]